MTSLKEQLLTLERGFWQASGNPDFYAEHFAADGLAVLPMENGIMNAETVLASVGDGASWTALEFTNAHCREIAPGVVTLAYEARAKRADNGVEYHVLLGSVYRQEGDDWQMVMHQQTPLS